MATATESGADPAPPAPHEFAEQLIRQVCSDLDGFLYAGADAVDAAWPLVAQAAAAGTMRGAVPVVFTRAALAAHHRLLHDEAPEPALTLDDATAAFARIVPAAAAQAGALKAQAERLIRHLAIAEQSRDPIDVPLSQAIQRFYVALAEDNAERGHRAMLELRSIVLHLDANAALLDDLPGAVEPIRVLRPDRFHDWFLQYAELARSPEGRRGEHAVATLSRDGRIEAVVVEDTHPLEAAAAAVRGAIDGDDTTRDHALIRIRALLDVLDGLRRSPNPLIGDALKDDVVYLSLVLAAATAPLAMASGFRHAALVPIARYNQFLLRGAGRRA